MNTLCSYDYVLQGNCKFDINIRLIIIMRVKKLKIQDLNEIFAKTYLTNEEYNFTNHKVTIKVGTCIVRGYKVNMKIATCIVRSYKVYMKVVTVIIPLGWCSVITTVLYNY